MNRNGLGQSCPAPLTDDIIALLRGPSTRSIKRPGDVVCPAIRSGACSCNANNKGFHSVIIVRLPDHLARVASRQRRMLICAAFQRDMVSDDIRIPGRERVQEVCAAVLGQSMFHAIRRRVVSFQVAGNIR